LPRHPLRLALLLAVSSQSIQSIGDALALHQAGKLQEALRAYHGLAARRGADPADVAMARNNACALQMDLGDYRGALPDCREALRLLRAQGDEEAVGRATVLMVDANQSLTTAEAIRRGRALDELGCFWFEEPLPAADLDGYAELAAALDIPVATGENLYGRHAFAPFVRSSIATAETWSAADWCHRRCSAGSNPRL